MHFSWNIDIGTAVTWVLVAGGFVYKAGAFTASVNALTANLNQLKTDFRGHADDDAARFEAMQETLNQILLKGAL